MQSVQNITQLAPLADGNGEIQVALEQLDAAIAEWVAALTCLREAGIDLRKLSKGSAAPAKLLSGQSPRGRRKSQPAEPEATPDAPLEQPAAVNEDPGAPVAGQITADDEAFLAKLSAEDANAIRVRRRLTGRSVQELAAELNVKPVEPKGKTGKGGKDTGRKAWWRNEE